MAINIGNRPAGLASVTQTTKSLQRLSSGSRLLTDDPAGAAVAENLGTRGDSEAAARRATSDGIGSAQVAEGATSEVGDLLKQMRELAVSASSGTVGNAARTAYQKDFATLQQEINRIAEASEFNGMSLTDGTRSSLSVQAGIDGGSDSQIQLSLGDLRAGTLGVDLASIDLSSASNAQNALSGLDRAIDDVNQYSSDYGSGIRKMTSSLRNSETSSIALSSAASQINDVDYAKEAAVLAAQTLKDNISIVLQGQANGLGQNALQLLGA
ncbi:MAG: hypothetical protein GWP91_22490 [Rhodobacterales bacterium]|nr:hypothetical protein [Rhodobacterales bacterium]